MARVVHATNPPVWSISMHLESTSCAVSIDAPRRVENLSNEVWLSPQLRIVELDLIVFYLKFHYVEVQVSMDNLRRRRIRIDLSREYVKDRVADEITRMCLSSVQHTIPHLRKFGVR